MFKNAEKLTLSLNNSGLSTTLRRIFIRYFRVNYFAIYRWDLEAFPPKTNALDEYLLHIDDFKLLEQIRTQTHALSFEFHIDNLYGGKSFYLITYHGEPASIVWAFNRGQFSRYFQIKSKDAVELQYVYTIPQFRGMKLQSHISNSSAQDLKSKGIRFIYVVINESNINSIRGIQNKTGFIYFKTIKSYFARIKKIVI